MKTHAMVEQAQLLIDNENYEKALSILQSAYDRDKNNPEILEKLALLYKTLESQQEAADYFERLLEVQPDSIVAHSELMDIYLRENKYKYYLTRAKYKVIQGNINQAVSDYKKAIESTTDEKEIITARLLLGKAYEFLKKTSNAVDEYYRILDYEDDLGIYYKLAELYSQTGDKHSAVNILERALGVFPSEESLKEMLANLYIETNDLDNALKYVKSDLTRAKIYLMQGKNDLAYEVLGKIEDTKPAQYDALMAEYHYNQKNFDDCVACVECYKKKSPDSPLIYQMLALVEEEKNNMHKSHYYWGRYYLVKNDEQMALNEFLIGHNIKNDEENTIREIIKIYESNKDNGVIEFYEKLLAIEPDNAQALKKLGNFYQEMHEFSNALNYYERALKVNNKDSDIYYQVGKCYEKLRNNVLAKEYYEKFLAKAPVNQETQTLKVRLQNMSDEVAQEDEGLLEKIMKIFSK